MTTAEFTRRRKILLRHIGHDVRIKRQFVTPRLLQRGAAGVAKLLDVKRTRAVIAFGGTDQWSVPIDQVLLPFSTEPAPGQIELFA